MDDVDDDPVRTTPADPACGRGALSAAPGSRLPGMAIEDKGAWRKSSYSGGSGSSDCVEVAFVANEVGVRDSKNTEGPTLAFPATTCSQVVKRPRWFQVPILSATLISASWQASSASGP